MLLRNWVCSILSSLFISKLHLAKLISKGRGGSVPFSLMLLHAASAQSLHGSRFAALPELSDLKIPEAACTADSLTNVQQTIRWLSNSHSLLRPVINESTHRSLP